MDGYQRVSHLSLLALLVAATVATAQQPEAKPLIQAHAHNDYHHPRPLMDALDHGFCGVEADIFLVDGNLLVGHDPTELRPERTLQSLYLDPLRRRVNENGGRVYPGGPTMTLLVDIKTNGVAVYDVLRKVLATYKDILCSVEKGEYHQRAVQVVISGDRPVDEITSDSVRYVGIDGRLTDLDSTVPAPLMPLISDRWTLHFQWRGVGEIPAEERARLRSIVNQAHAAGRRVRFWATPEEPRLWSELLAAGVDHINTDRLDELNQFLVHSPLPILGITRCNDFQVTGKGDAKSWDATSWVSLNRRPGAKHDYSAQFKMLYSDTGVYVLFDGSDTKLTATMKEDFLDLWNEDVFECFFWTDQRDPVYFEYEISPLGYELPILIPNLGGKFLGWRPWHYEGDRKIQKRVSATGGDNTSMAEVTNWRAEVFIPYEVLQPLRNVPPQSGDRWRANFYRVDYDDDQASQWDWARVGQSFHEFDGFGTLVFE